MREFKIVVMGAGAVGKSALVTQYVLKRFPDEHDPTIEDMYPKHTVVDGEPYYVEILDTAGLEQFTAMRELYIRNADAFVLVYAIDSAASFAEMPALLQMIHRHGRRYRAVSTSTSTHTSRSSRSRVPSTQSQTASLSNSHNPPGSPYMRETGPPLVTLVGNKMDLSTELRQVTAAEGQELSRQYGASFCEASARFPSSVQDIFESLVRRYAVIEGPLAGPGGTRRARAGSSSNNGTYGNSGPLASLDDSLYCDSVISPPYSGFSSRLPARKSLARLRHSRSVQRLASAHAGLKQRASQFFRRDDRHAHKLEQQIPSMHSATRTKATPPPSPEVQAVVEQSSLSSNSPVRSVEATSLARKHTVGQKLKKLASEPFLNRQRPSRHVPSSPLVETVPNDEGMDMLGLSMPPEIEIVDSKSRCTIM